MKQRLAKTIMHGKSARTAFALLAAGMALSGCEPSQSGQSDKEGRSPPITEANGSGGPAVGPAMASSKAVASAQKTAEAAAESAENKGLEVKSPQTIHDRLLSAATSKVWEIRERINATSEQDLHVTVTLQIGAGGHPVSVMGATAMTKGGATRDVSDILSLDTAGLVVAPTGAKRQTTESIVIRGE